MAVERFSRRVQIFVAIIAAGAIGAGLFALFIYNLTLYAQQRVSENLILKEGTVGWDRFVSTSQIKSLRVSFSLFNLTNPVEVQSRSATELKLNEIGPFVYDEFKYKEILEVKDGIITYKPRRRFVFNPNRSISVDPKQARITWPNVPVASVFKFIDVVVPEDVRDEAHKVLATSLESNQEGAFISDTVENFIFTGSHRPAMERMRSAVRLKPGVDEVMASYWPLNDDKFAILYNQNDTWLMERDFNYTVAGGYGPHQTFSDINLFGRINDLLELPFWPNGTQCAEISGTDGFAFGPNPSDTLTVYLSDVCRKFELSYRRTVLYKGLSAYMYTFDERTMQGSANNKENDCYCLAESTMCELDGLLDMSTCPTAYNVYASGSHFLYSPAEIRGGLGGVRPMNATLDEPRFYVEPKTGLPIHARVPLQYNVHLFRHPKHAIFNFVKKNGSLMVPLLTMTESAEIDDVMAGYLRERLLVVDPIFTSVVLCIILVMIFIIITGLSMACIRYNQHKVKSLIMSSTAARRSVVSSVANSAASSTARTVKSPKSGVSRKAKRPKATGTKPIYRTMNIKKIR